MKFDSKEFIEVTHYLMFDLNIDFECNVMEDNIVFKFIYDEVIYSIDLLNINNLNEFKGRMKDIFKLYIENLIEYHKRSLKYHSESMIRFQSIKDKLELQQLCNDVNFIMVKPTNLIIKS